MALLITGSNTLFVHVPKTGGHWVEYAIDRLGLAHAAPQLIQPACPRHGLPHHFAAADFRFCTVRNPIDWAKSYWRYHAGSPPLPFADGVEYPFSVFGSVAPETFREWIEFLIARPGIIGEFFDSYVRECDSVMRCESLDRDLADVLARRGHSADRNGGAICPERLGRIAFQNVTRPRPAECPESLLDELRKTERDALRRWYP